MGTYSLICHPDTPALGVRAVHVTWAEGEGALILSWHVEGAGRLVIPALVDQPAHTDGLWKTSCFELFLDDTHGYREFNFSPSGHWASYGFDGYRSGMKALPLEAPQMDVAVAEDFALTVTLPGNLLQGASHASLTAVIEEEGGHKSYWALAHASGQPDFHAPSCFILPLGAAQQP
ncbi:DOMON-like domain-containing protein [Novosphingobium terrae]|uniref:DOMON-like domain-containing protein n=1 Tax=Novosphingobium terrae TaxID=2726189 RepID=UPI00197D1362|nr:DOMON-like domain-containing protein [Novosphingobium terrae]